MLSRMSINALLKSVVATLAGGIVLMLAFTAWESWNRVKAVNRISAVAEASGHLFTALHNLRVDRSTTARELTAERAAPGLGQLARQSREADMPALKAGLAAIESANFTDRQAAVTALAQSISKLEELHKETAAAVTQPKSQRRANLVQDYVQHTTALMELIDKISSQMTRDVKLEDAFTSQLFEIKQLAWVARNAAGDASVIISNAMGGLPLPPDPMVKYYVNLAKLETAWAALEDVASGVPLPPRLVAAIEKGRTEFLGKDYSDLRLKMLNAVIAGQKVDMSVDDWSRASVAKLASLLGVAEMALDVAKEHAAVQRASALQKMSIEVGFLLLAIVIALGAMVVVSRRVIAPLRQVQETLLKVADGDFSVDVKTVARKDEVGSIVNAIATMIHKVRTTISEIKQSAREVTNASAEISTSTTDLSQRTEEQAASLEETSASMEEISATVKKNAENAQQANQFAAETRTVAERGGAVVADAVTAMARIEESSRKISDIIGVIDEIARQTNLLALNAAVEAARAGEAGRGFAVVATEVRSLAQRSSQAAKDIKDLITNSSSQVKDGVDLVNKAGTSLAEIVASIKKVADIVSDIASASAEQATGLEQVNKALAQMDEVTQQNSALVEENAATAKTLENQAKAMDEQVAVFVIDEADGAAHAGAPAAEKEKKAAEAEKAKPQPASAPKVVASNPPAKPARAAAPKPAVAAAAVAGRRGGPVGRMQTALATAINEDADWKEF
jgi:methyl-accepting chemotaxis protein